MVKGVTGSESLRVSVRLTLLLDCGLRGVSKILLVPPCLAEPYRPDTKWTLRFWSCVYDIELINPALDFNLWWSGWRLATLQVERVGFPVGSRWSAGGRNDKAARCKRALEIRTLSGWDARYTEKKARRGVTDFAGCGLGIFTTMSHEILGCRVTKVCRPQPRSTGSYLFRV